MEMITSYKDHNYPIVMYPGSIERLHMLDYDKIIYIVDEVVYERFEVELAEVISGYIIKVKAGERLKTFAQYQYYAEYILNLNITRNTCLVAIGGGTVGDFVGFLAATLLRGISYIQVPTTLLAHDSAIGGKVGINAASGKNLIGAFKRPVEVIFDTNFLKELSYSEKLSGFGEIIKHASLTSEEAVFDLMQDIPNRQSLEQLQNVEKWLMHGMQLKLNFVIEDEYEGHARKFLNLGHTFGHALEFAHKIPHGQAVMIGLLYALILSEKDVTKVLQWYRQLELQYPKWFDFETYYKFIQKDKKIIDGNIQFVTVRDGLNVETVSKDKMEEVFNKMIQLTGGAYD